ncbi:MAG TPA: GNAT family N-acetyltransferase [Tepidiformaceae bacterium]|nr:GNAT family N-acetyltransferase [Tepidiformaceae bacterium]
MSKDLNRLVVATGPRVRIRLKDPSDALDDYSWRRDPDVSQYDAVDPTALPFSDFLERLENEIRFPHPDRRMYSLMDPAGTHIGNIMYYNVTASRDAAEVGISIGVEAYRGAGLGTEAMITFVRYLWDTTSFRLLFLHTLDWNERAQQCFRKAGFSATSRVLREPNVFVRMEARREWWLMHENDGRFAKYLAARTPSL